MQGQAEVTQAFGCEGSQAWGRYANARQLEAALDSDAGGADCWGASGACRTAGHVVIGALGGGSAGALGAGLASQGAPLIHAGLTEAGLSPAGSDLATALLSAGLGAIGGGSAGAAAAFNEVNNNFLTSQQQNAFAAELSGCESERCMDEVAQRYQVTSDLNKQSLAEAQAHCASTGQCGEFIALLDAGTPVGKGYQPEQTLDPLAPWLSEEANAASRSHNEQVYLALMARSLDQEVRYIGPSGQLEGFYRGANRSDNLNTGWTIVGAGAMMVIPGPEDLAVGAVLATKTGQKIGELVLDGGQKVWRMLDGTVARGGERVAVDSVGVGRALPGDAGHFGANTVSPGGTGTALTGHGGKFQDSPSFVVPEGSAVTLPRADISILDRTGQYIEKGDWEGLAALAKVNPRVANDIEGMTSWLPGAEVPGYTLFPPDKAINLFSQSHSVYQPTPLQQILEPNLGCVQWAACTSFLPYPKP